MKHSADIKMQVLHEIESLLGDRFGEKMKQPDAALLEVHAQGKPEEDLEKSPLEEAGESLAEEKAEGDEPGDMSSDDDRIHELMTRSGNMMGDEDESPADAESVKKMLLMKKMKG